MIIRFRWLKRAVYFLVFVLILGALLFHSHFIWKVFYPLPYRDAVFRYSEQFQLDPYLVASVIRVESKFNPYAESSRGAVGLMQLMPDTAEWVAGQMAIDFKREKLLDPEYNIKLGCWYLADLQAEFGGPVWSLAAYNGGRGNVKQWLEREKSQGDLGSVEGIPFQETRDFVSRVLADYERYKWIYGEEGKVLDGSKEAENS